MNLIAQTLQKLIEEIMHFTIHNFLRISKENNISMPQLGTLMGIYHKKSSVISNIGDELGISNAAASQMSERLVQQELVTRTENPTDRRVKQLELTPKGTQIIESILEDRQQKLDSLVKILTQEEQQYFLGILNKVIEKMKTMEKSSRKEAE